MAEEHQLTTDTENTIKPKFNFSVSPPQVGWSGTAGSQHENYDPTTGEYPQRLNALNADKFNELERSVDRIVNYMGDVHTNIAPLTVGSKIRAIEDQVLTSTISSQLLYVLATVGGGVLPGNINDDEYDTKPINGKFNISNIVESGFSGGGQGYKLTVNPGSAIVGNKTSNTKGFIIPTVTYIELPEAPTFDVGSPEDGGDPKDPSTWPQDGELHNLPSEADYQFYLDHKFIKTAAIPFGGSASGDDLATIVAVRKDNPLKSSEPGSGKFGVDLTTGRVWSLGFFDPGNPNGGPGEYYFYYKHYGWRVDSVYCNVPGDGESEEITLEQGTDMEDFSEVLTSKMGIKDDYTSTTEVPSYIILVTPQNNISETETQVCATNTAIHNCGYSTTISTDENIVDIRRFISPIKKTKKTTNGPIEGGNQIIDVDQLNEYIRLDAAQNGVSGLPSTYDVTRKLLIQPQLHMVNDIPVETQTSLVDISAGTSGFVVTNIYAQHPDGDIVAYAGSETTNWDELEEPEQSDYSDYDNLSKIASIIVNQTDIKTIVPALAAQEYVLPISDNGIIDGTSKELIVTHNIGCDYVAVAIPLEQPGGSFPHIIADYVNNNVTRFLYDNGGSDLKIRYAIIPTYGNSTTVPLSSSSATVYHGGFKNSRMAYSIMGSTTSNLGSEIGALKITKKNNYDTVTLTQAGGSTYSIKATKLINEIVDTHTKQINLLSSSSKTIPGNVYLTKQVGIVVNFQYQVTDNYWLDIDDGVNNVTLKLDSAQGSDSFIDTLILNA